MTSSGHPPHLDQFLSNIDEVSRLQAIHARVTPPGRGRKYDVEVIHKSCIVLLVACWEAFVEDLAASALEFMLANAKDHKSFPKEVLSRVASNCQGDKAWSLAGDGWKSAMKGNLKGILAKTTGVLNTPKTEQVNELFNKTVGLPKISSSWFWQKKSITTNEQFLDDLVVLRGSIAHRVMASKPVSKRHVVQVIDFVSMLAMKSHNATNQYVKKAIGAEPWSTVTYRGRH